MKILNDNEVEQVGGGWLTSLAIGEDWSWLVPWYDAAVDAAADALCSLSGKC